MGMLVRLSTFLMGLLLAGTAAAQWESGPLGIVDSKTSRVQTKVESLYEQGEYERAHFIYLNELAPAGDKYAQYMLGYMSLMGKGATEDPITASGWYRLAAERGAPEFRAVRDQLMAALDDAQLAQSDALYLDLRRRYGDVVVVLKEYERELQSLSANYTGSRIRNVGGIVTIIDPRTGMTVSLDDYQLSIRNRMQKYLDFIGARVGVDGLRGELDKRELEFLRQRIEEYLSKVDDR